MGPGLTHTEQIIELYLQGYTETEIVRRTGHTYASIENYIVMFSRVVSLLERKMPLPLIRQTIGCSMKLVQKHAALYSKYDTPDYQFMLMQIRRIFESHSTKKKRSPSLQKEDAMGRTTKGVRVYQSLVECNLVMAQKKELALRFELSDILSLGSSPSTFLTAQKCSRLIAFGNLLVMFIELSYPSLGFKDFSHMILSNYQEKFLRINHPGLEVCPNLTMYQSELISILTVLE